ncbi:MAG: hypothetical protein H6565_04975 [Lewinellaceae bacterium]|nr:hypothetical protein [Lewinellaceae bacterium]
MEKPTASSLSFLGNLPHSKTPFQFIVMSCIITVITTAGFELNSENHWNIIFFTTTLVLFLSILITFLAKYEISEVDYDKQMRFARSFGISIATLCFLFAGKKAINDGDVFPIIAYPSIIQILIFFIYVFVKETFSENGSYQDTGGVPISRKINYLQLCLITTSLLVGVATSAGLKTSNNGRYNVSHYESAMFMLLTMWIICIMFWIYILIQKTSVTFKIRGDFKSID